MRNIVLFVCLAMQVACGPASEPSTAPGPPSAEAAPETEPPLSPLETLVGEYRIAGIDGTPIEGDFGLALSVTESRLIFDGPCGGYAWDYRLAATRIATTRTVSPDPACVTAVKFPARVFDLVAVLDAVTQAGRTPSNGIALSFGGRSVTLYSQ